MSFNPFKWNFPARPTLLLLLISLSQPFIVIISDYSGGIIHQNEEAERLLGLGSRSMSRSSRLYL